MIEFNCSNCSRKMRVAEDYAGKRVKCRSCGQATRVPDSRGQPAQDSARVIKFRCTHCNQKIGLPIKYAGKRVRCAKCAQPIQVPGAKEQAGQAEPAKIRFACGNCGQKFAVPAKYAGKRIKCTKCQQPVSVPSPKPEPKTSLPVAAALDTGDSTGEGSWADDLLAMEAAAPEAEDVLRVAPPAPVAEAAGARADDAPWMRGLGAAPSGPEARARPRFSIGAVPVAIAASFAGALLGALIWAVVARVTGFEIGFVAWGVGALAGAGMSIFSDRQSILLGLLAAVFALAGIMMGKVFVAKWCVLPELKKMMQRVQISSEHIEQIVDSPEMMFAVASLELAEKDQFDEQFAWEVLAAHVADESEVQKSPEIQAAEKKAEELLAQWSEGEKRMAARKQANKVVKKISDFVIETPIGLLVAFIATFSLFDLLWFPIALASAYKIGSGRGE